MFNMTFKSIFCWHKWQRAYHSDWLSTYQCEKCEAYKNKAERFL